MRIASSTRGVYLATLLVSSYYGLLNFRTSTRALESLSSSANDAKIEGLDTLLGKNGSPAASDRSAQASSKRIGVDKSKALKSNYVSASRVVPKTSKKNKPPGSRLSAKSFVKSNPKELDEKGELPPPFTLRDSMKSGDAYATKGLPLYCKWTQNATLYDGCQSMATSFFKLSSTPKPFSSWYFLGDSTMGRTAFQFKKSLKPMFDLGMSTYDWCDQLKLFGFEKRDVWQAPGKGEGPTARGKKEPFCHDASTSSFRATGSTMDATFIAMEYSRDVSIQTQTTNTTQETVARYLRERAEEKGNRVVTNCVVNSGIHEVRIKSMRKSWLANNTEWYLDQLMPVCTRILWLTSSASLDLKEQKNIKLYANNMATKARISRINDRNKDSPIMVVDVWEKSLNSLHLDNVHLNDGYYRELGQWLANLATNNEIEATF